MSCHFSSDGKLLASAGHDKKVNRSLSKQGIMACGLCIFQCDINFPCSLQAFLYSMDSFKLKSTLEEHNSIITDVRFSPSSTRLATSSFDRTVRVWDAENVSWKNLLHAILQNGSFNTMLGSFTMPS